MILFLKDERQREKKLLPLSHKILTENFSELLKSIVTLTDTETPCVTTASILDLQRDSNPSGSWRLKIWKKVTMMTQTKKEKGRMNLMKSITSFNKMMMTDKFKVKLTDNALFNEYSQTFKNSKNVTLFLMHRIFKEQSMLPIALLTTKDPI